MKIFGRRPERYILGLKALPSFLVALWRVFIIFRHPLIIIWSYILRKPLRDGTVRLRNGRVIYLSEDSADIVTIFLIFAREDYGKIIPGTIIIDIGANIGVFALFAAFSGAKRVYAFEPCASSYELMLKNIRANGLGSIIHANCLAVVGFHIKSVKFPRHSNVMNAILSDFSDYDDYNLVQTITLPEIISHLNSVDLLKLDCEGAEYDILLQAGNTVIQKIREIRMEYHCGPIDKIIARMDSIGYAVRQFISENHGGGYLWLIRTKAL
ncbi:MAG: FkbM family methyltransferase [Desulfobacterales bacterium]|nr:FkbM family methyltransferase [Desulfobacterales bacterium]